VGTATVPQRKGRGLGGRSAPGTPQAPRPPRRISRRSVRVRLSLLYGALFVASGLVVFLDNHITGRLRAGLPGDGVALAIMAALSLGLGWLMAGRVLRPLRTITAKARHISGANLHERLALGGPEDELKALGDTIDDLLGRLEEAFEAQRSFVANVSHELRTPLTMMRTSIDVATRKARPLSEDAAVIVGKVRKGLDQADRLVEGFLVLARAQRGALTDLMTVSLAELASSALAAQEAAATERGIAVRAELGEAFVAGDETLLGRMAANVVDNAVRYNEPGGSITLRIATDGPVARLIVESGGAVLDQEKVSRLAQPFRRLAAERTGSTKGVGLGLSIVSAVATAHGGRLELQARPEGGLRVVVELPRAAAPAQAGGQE
jgi:signal transduction histidine kinase